MNITFVVVDLFSFNIPTESVPIHLRKVKRVSAERRNLGTSMQFVQ